MRLSNATDAKLLELAEGHRRIGNPLMASLLYELIDRRAEMTPLRLSEMSFAYERAGGVIEAHCLRVEVEPGDWYDLDDVSGVEDVNDEVEYLQSRGLLDFHLTSPRWVAIRDEGEGAS